MRAVVMVNADAPLEAEQARLRRALGQFATGVAVVTGRRRDGRRLGVTVNSFTSVSLVPPMVLWCISKTTPSHAEFRAATHVAVHILAAGQHDVARRFAVSADDKFGELVTTDGRGGVPLLAGVIARYQCRTVHWYDGGDHSIVVGEVEAYETFDGDPLVFHSGGYRVAADHPDLIG